MLSVLGRRKDGSKGPWTFTPSPKSAAKSAFSRRARMAARCFESWLSSVSTICRNNGRPKSAHGGGGAFVGTKTSQKAASKGGKACGEQPHRNVRKQGQGTQHSSRGVLIQTISIWHGLSRGGGLLGVGFSSYILQSRSMSERR